MCVNAEDYLEDLLKDNEADGPAFKIENDPRITKVGKFIRKTSIDELPQLINILKGDMTFVGPRPERIEHVEQYTKELPEFAYRMRVKGGLTGYAINPARDLGPRIAHAMLPIAGKRDSNWGYSWIPVVGPVIGAILAVLLYGAIF